jgi:hypothetical protein
LSANIFEATREAPRLKNPSFYMYAYLIDVICSSIPFLQWVGTGTLIYPLCIYNCCELWESNYKKHVYDICDHFITPMFFIIFNKPLQKLSQGAIEALKDIGK